MRSMYWSSRLVCVALLAAALAAAPQIAWAGPRPQPTAQAPLPDDLLGYGVVDAGQLDLPVVLLPWWAILRHEVEEAKIKKLQEDCLRDLRVIFGDVPEPLKRVKEIEKLDLKYRPKLLDLLPEEVKRKLKEMFGNLDKLRAMMKKYLAMLEQERRKAGLQKPLLLYADRTGGRQANLQTQVLLLAADRLLVREHILLDLILADPALKLTPEQKLKLRDLDAERRKLIADANKGLPPRPKRGPRLLLRKWNVELIAKTEKLVKENTDKRLKLMTPQQQTLVRGIFKVAEQAEQGMGGTFKDVCNEMDTIGGNGPE